MQKIVKDKNTVAFLGSSLPMLIFAYIYKKKTKSNVVILNNSQDIGGAWGLFKYKNIRIRKQSNVILPLTKKQERNQKKINFFLKKYLNIKIQRINRIANIKYSYKNKFDYKFDNFIKLIHKLNIIKKIKVNKLRVLSNEKILVNQKNVYDKVFFPSFFGIDKIYEKKKITKIDFKIIKSEHIVALIKKTKFKNLFYSDFFNTFFDRVLITKHKNFYTFSGRITKKYKGSRKNTIKKNIQKISEDGKIIKFYKFNVINYYRDKKQIKKLKFFKRIRNIEYINTSNFILVMEQLFRYFKYKSIKSKLFLSR